MASTIGIDLGGTKISGILLDDKGKITKKLTKPTQAQKSREEILKNIFELIEQLKSSETTRIGIGIPGFCNNSGQIIFMPNIQNLLGINLKQEIENKTSLAVTIENDAKCFALAETWLGAAKGKKNVIGITIGTGVGAGIILDGKLYKGACGTAGELGQTKIFLAQSGEAKYVESLISGTALLKRYNELSGKNVQSLKKIWKFDKHYKQAYSEFLTYAGIFFANTINSFNPDMIVVGGGVSNLKFYKDLEKEVKKHAIPASANACPIKKNKLGDDAGVLGAAILVR